MISELIVSSPDILGSTPVFKGTRVPVKKLFDYLSAGDTVDEFLDDFPSVEREVVGQVLKLSEILPHFMRSPAARKCQFEA
jgi:uncharacterized protein (DUF433 family)